MREKREIPVQMKVKAMQDAARKPSESVYKSSLSIGQQESDREALLLTLRNAAETQGGLGALAKRIDLNRTHLYRALSPGGNPNLKTLRAILNGLGFRMYVEAATSIRHDEN